MCTTEEKISSTINSVKAESAALLPPGSDDAVDDRQPALQPPSRPETSGRAEPQAAVTGWRGLIGREVLVYLAEQGQLDVDAFNLLGFWNRRGSDSVCPTTSTVTSPAEMRYLAFIARLYHAIKATSCQAERIFSALAHIIGDLRSRKGRARYVHSAEQAFD